MFYSEFTLTKKGPLARVWLAAHYDSKLSKQQITQTDVKKSCKDISEPTVPIALRTSGHLLLGVVKIYRRKVKYVVADCNETMMRIKMRRQTISHGHKIGDSSIDLPKRNQQASFAQITLPEKLTELDLMLPDVDLQLLSKGSRLNTGHFQMSDALGWQSDTTPMDESLPFGPFGLTQSPYRTPEDVREQRTPQDFDEDRIVDYEPVADDDIPLITPDHDDQAPEIMDDYDIPEADVEEEQPVKRTRKRKRAVLQDDPIEIPEKTFREHLRNPQPLKRRRRFAPSTIVESQQALTRLDDIYLLPSTTELPVDLHDFYRQSLKRGDNRGELDEAELRETAFDEPDIPDYEPEGSLHFGNSPNQLGSDRSEDAFTETPPRGMEAMPIVTEEIKNYETKLQKKHKDVTKETLTFASLLNNVLQPPNDTITLQNLLGKDSTRLMAAQCFYQSLVLKSNNVIDIDQQDAYGDLSIVKGEKFSDFFA